jgi:uncharacterized protein YecE (DUF72 family)
MMNVEVDMESPVPVYYIGISGWTYDHWMGVFYPDSLPKTRWLSFYMEKFNSVEVNATFYRNFSDHTYMKWGKQASDAFCYTLKVPQLITHRKFLNDCQTEIIQFTHSASLLNDRLGMYLLQIAPSMPLDMGLLRETILAFGNPAKVAVEFRSVSWNQAAVRELLDTLGAVMVNVDSPRSRLADWTTGESAYLRLHGRRRWYDDDYTTGELHGIADAARKLVSSGAKRVYIYFNNDTGGYAPRNSMLLKTMLINSI